MKREFMENAFDGIRERLEERFPNLSAEAVDHVASGMIQRIIGNELSTDKQKEDSLYRLMKGEF